MRNIFIYLTALVIWSCQHRSKVNSVEAEEFQANVLGSESAQVPTVDWLRFACNNASKNSYRNGHILAEFSPNFVINIYGDETKLSRAVFIEEASLEKNLGDYSIENREQSGGLTVYTFRSIVDDAKITLTINNRTSVANTELISPENPKGRQIELLCEPRAQAKVKSP